MTPIIRRDLIGTVLLTFCLTVTLFKVLPISSQSAGDYDAWYDINDDGVIDMKDIGGVARKFGTSGTPINKTDLLLDLLDRVEALENQSVPLGYIGPPAYDSGWVNLTTMFTTITHNLGTTEVLLYFIGRRSDEQIHNQHYGGIIFFDNIDYHYRGVFLQSLSENSATFWRGDDDLYYDQIRVQIWKIQEP